jgi:PUA domain protein
MAKIITRKRHSIRKSQMQELMRKLSGEIGSSSALFEGGQIEIAETTAPFGIYLVDRKPHLFSRGDWVFPTLRGAVERVFPERRVTVDTGAVRFVVNGADIMRPGIVAVTDDVRAGRPVQVVEERHGKPLAIGLALFDAAEMRAHAEGKMVKNLHYVGDELWNLEF